MKKSTYAKEPIDTTLRLVDTEALVTKVTRKQGIREATF